jgi:hypothetical protein
MAFVPGHKHDLFVSYAKVDNQHGWVTELVRALKIQLAAWLGRSDAFDVWWDRTDLEEAGSLDDQIVDSLDQAAALVVVLSRAYMASPWCKQERELFLEAVRRRELADKRTFLVDLGNLDVENRPEEFSEYLGFSFWEKDETERRRTMGFPIPDLKKHADFYVKVDDVAKRIADRLNELLKLSSVPGKQSDTSGVVGDSETSAEVSRPAVGGPTIFLAEATEDLESERNDVVRYLHQHQFNVVPDDPYPIDITACQAAIDDHLGQSIVYAQLLGDLKGKKLVGNGQTKRLAKMQMERADAAKMKIVQWRTDLELDKVKDEDHKSLLTGVHVMTGELENFKREIVRLATPQEEPPSIRPDGGSSDIPFIYVNNGVEDRDTAEKLAGLLGGMGCMVEFQVGNGDPAKFRKQQQEYLLECDGVVYLYGRIPVTWVREQLRSLRKIIARRKRPLTVAICEGPPDQKSPLGMVFPGMQSIDCRTKLSEDELQAFVQQIRPGAGS